jgi:ribosomal protein S19
MKDDRMKIRGTSTATRSSGGTSSRTARGVAPKKAFVEPHLLEKADAVRRSNGSQIIKIWSRRSKILPEFVGLTFRVGEAAVTVSQAMVGRKFGEVVPARVRGKIRADIARLRFAASAKEPSEPSIGLESEPQPSLSPSAYAPGPRARAVLKGIEIAEDDLRSSGGAYDLEQVRRLLHGVSRQRIDRRVQDGSLLAVPGPSNKRYFPAAQFGDDGAVVEGLRETQNALPTRNGFAVLNFLVNPDARLGGRRPIDLLRAGEIEPVIEAARRVGEQGA